MADYHSGKIKTLNPKLGPSLIDLHRKEEQHDDKIECRNEMNVTNNSQLEMSATFGKENNEDLNSALIIVKSDTMKFISSEESTRIDEIDKSEDNNSFDTQNLLGKGNVNEGNNEYKIAIKELNRPIIRKSKKKIVKENYVDKENIQKTISPKAFFTNQPLFDSFQRIDKEDSIASTSKHSIGFKKYLITEKKQTSKR